MPEKTEEQRAAFVQSPIFAITVACLAVASATIAILTANSFDYDVRLVPVSSLPRIRGSVNVPKVARSGEHVFLCDEHQGLTVWDVSQPDKPVRVAETAYGFRNIHELKRDGNLLLISADHGPSVFDITDPRAPAKLDDAGGIDVAVLGGWIFVSGAQGVYGRPLLGSAGRPVTLDENLPAPGLARLGEHHLIAVASESVVTENAEEGDEPPFNVVVWDVSSPSAPKRVHASLVSGDLQRIAVHENGQTAYVASTDRGVLVLDVRDPTAPKQVSLVAGLVAFHVYIDGDWLFAQHNANAIYVLDISEPDAPRVRARYETRAAGVAGAPGGHIVVGSFDDVELLRAEPEK